MNGKITIDGYLKDGTYEIISHGGQPNPAAVCSLTYDYEHKEEVLDLLSMIRNSLQAEVDAEQEQKEAEIRKAKINSILLKEGYPGLSDGTLDRIANACSCSGCEYLDGCGQAAVN